MSVEIVRRGTGKKYPVRELRQTATEILRLLERERTELSLALVGNAEIRRLNARYRNKNYATDVLSFPVAAGWSGPVELLGDVVISVDKARTQARAHGRTMREEITALLIHGVVHLLGYDHERSPREARTMERLERKVYRALCERKFLRV